MRRRHAGLAVIGVAARNRPWGEGEMMAGLTGSRMGGSFDPGKRWSERAAKGISGGPRSKKTAGTAIRGFRRCLDRCRRHRRRWRGSRSRRRGTGKAVAAAVLLGGLGWLRRERWGERGRNQRGRERCRG